MKTLLVTVGSTQFNDLIVAVENDQIGLKRVVRDFRIERIVIQHGRSKAPKLKLDDLDNLIKVDIRDYIEPERMTRLLCESTIIISHGGAGTIFEVLRGNHNELEAFLIVENEDLMDAHQSELVDTLEGMKCPIQRIGGIKNDSFAIFNEIKCGKFKEFKEFKLPEQNFNPLTELINRYI